jgi:hypothetical protein
MFAFNAHFNYGLTYLLLVLLVLVVCQLVPINIPKAASLIFVIIGVLCFAFVTRGFNLRSDLPTIAFPSTASSQLKHVLRADPKRTKFLSFPHSYWPSAVTLALAIRRQGSDFAISPNWTFMFGQRSRYNYIDALNSSDFAVWRVGKTIPGAAGFELSDGTFVAIAGPRADPAKTEISFTGPDANWSDYALAGWGPEGPAAGDLDNVVGVLEFRPDRTTRNVTVSVLFAPDERRVDVPTVSFNGHELNPVPSSSRDALVLTIPAELWNEREVARLVFRAVPPVSASDSAGQNSTALAIRFGKVRFASAED